MNEDCLYLLTTTGCSLCEKAKQTLWSPLVSFQLKLIEVDIVEHDHLLSLFATSIPVISLQAPEQISSTHRVLAWPFSTGDVEKWLQADR